MLIIGITKLWFKPAYNPYTEPSMEIFGYHPILKKKIEIGNSGMFRPEMLKPMVILYLSLSYFYFFILLKINNN